MAHVQIFLSAVSNEFRGYRDALRRDLTRHNVSVAVQEDFIPTGTETVDKLDEYIRHCDAVIHLVGDMTGALAKPVSVTALRQRYSDLAERLPPLAPFLTSDAMALSYTQWEAWLTLYHGKQLIIAAPLEGAVREATYLLDEAQRHAQGAHLERLRSLARYPEIHFANADRLAVDLLRSKLQEILARAGPVVRPMNLPFQSLGQLFKGRDTHLDDLVRSFGAIPANIATPVVARVLNGLGGVGKTRLAIEYAWRQAETYSALLFVGADSDKLLQRNLAALCTSGILDLPEQTEREEAKQYHAVLNWLKNTPGWLLILDNVDSKPAAEAVEKLIPLLTGGHILITGRLADWSASLAPTHLDVLSLETAIEFLLARTDARRRKQADDPAHAQKLAEELGCLALALEQAGAYITQRRLSFDKYLSEWQSQRDKMLTWFDNQLMQYPKSVAITWQSSFDQLTAPAQRLLQRVAWLAPDPIPESLLETPLPEDSTVVAPFEALVALESYSLVTRAVDRPILTVHRLVQEVTRRTQRDKAGHTTFLETLRWIDAAFDCDLENPHNWSLLEPLLSHARVVATYADSAGIHEPTARLMDRAGFLFYKKAQYTEAESLLTRALEIHETVPELNPLDMAQILNDLAMLYRALGTYSKVVLLHRRVLPIREKVLGAEHPKVAESLNNLAELCRFQKLYVEAKALYTRALAISVKKLGRKDTQVLTILNNLAILYNDQGAYTKAKRLYQHVLTIREKVLGPGHLEVAKSCNNLATLYDDLRLYTDAEPLYTRALVIYKRVLGPEHPDVAATLSNLARHYHDQGNYASAEPLYQQALAIREKVLGLERPDVATSLNNLARLYYDQGIYPKAELLYTRALAIREKVLGSEHPDVAQSLNNLAQLLQARNRLAEAEPLMRRALTLFLVSLGSEHPSTRTVLENYKGLLQVMGKTEPEISEIIGSLLHARRDRLLCVIPEV